MPLTLFSWTHSGNYPAGPNAWSGQPLSIAPAQTYYTPNLKIPAENLNYTYGQIADSLSSIASGVDANLGSYYLKGIYTSPVGGLPGLSWSTTSIPGTGYTQLTSSLQSSFGGGVVFQASDLLEIDWTVDGTITNGTGVSSVFMGIATIIGAGTPVPVTGMQVQANSYLTATFVNWRLRAIGLASGLAGTAPGVLNLALAAAKFNVADPTHTITLFSNSEIVLKHYRVTTLL